MKQSKIEWTEATWNPIRGCSRVSEGCRFCYAERVADRFSGPGQPYEGLTTRGKDGQPRWNGEVMLAEHKLNDPLKWKKPRRIFVNSMSDLFHEKVPIGYIGRVFEIMRLAHWHQFQILTKRAKRLRQLSTVIAWAHNIWMGVSVENQECTERIDLLRKTKAHIKFLSLEPLIGPLPNLDLNDMNWVIVGGESGDRARIMEPEWAQAIVDRCRSAGVPVFVKQMGTAWAKREGSKSWKGDDFSEFPDALQVREYPKVPRDNVARRAGNDEQPVSRLVLQEGKLVEERGEGLLQEPVVMEDKPLDPNDPPKPLPKWLHEPKTRKRDRE